MQQFPQRRSIRLPGFDYSQANYYFVTICTHQRQNLFGNIIEGKMLLNKSGNIVKNEWHNIPKRFNNVETDKFIIMPNHFHGIIHVCAFENVKPAVGAIHELPVAPCPVGCDVSESIARAIHESPLRRVSLANIIAYFKYNSAKQINSIRQTLGQRNYYAHVIFDDKDYAAIWEYIDHNPNKWEFDRNFG